MIDRAAKTEDPFEAFVLGKPQWRLRAQSIPLKSFVGEPGRRHGSTALGTSMPWVWHAPVDSTSRCESYTKANVEAWTLRDFNWLGLALVHHHLGHPEEARRCLDKGIQWLEREGPAKLPPQDWLEAQLLRHEAEGMLNTKRGP